MNPDPTPSICLVGASCRAAAQSAARAGCSRILAWDDFLDADLLEIAQARSLADFPESCPQSLAELRGIPLVLCGGMENQPDFIQRRIDQGMLCGVTGKMLRQLRSIESWQRWASESRIGWPTTIQDLSDPRLESIRSESWMLKPVGRAGGVHVRGIASLEGLDHEAKLGPDPGNPKSNLWYLQEYIPGISIGVSYCTESNVSDELPRTRIVGIARSILSEELDAPLPWIYRGSLAPYSVSPKVQASLERFAKTVVKSTGIRGLWQADFQIDLQGQLWLLEINPRWSASMELHETLQGFSWITEHLRILKSGASKNVPGRGSPAGLQVAKGILYAPHAMHLSLSQVDRLWRFGWHGTLRELQTGEFCLADIPQSDPQGVDFAEGMPIVTVLVAGGENEDLPRKIRQARSTVLGWFKSI
ncbi:MAG: ATP-grasp domain-containing protein [Pirellula sp.]|nr:ATP-grasp domain-containing protein [Pirellula sp.]